ncbi:MAG: VWA domain-containing protein [Candidatus Omnitrophica bacterium]|nr:VWA domain-containing protein [Candidatus Omnitrophota bacterium]
MMHFASPIFFLALLILPWLFFTAIKKRRPSLRFPTLAVINKIKITESQNPTRLLALIRILALVLVILAMTRPQSTESEREVETKGIDIVIALDISGSMQAEDFHPQNRITVAKEEAKRFILGRKHDRIGLVVFARQSYTQCPMTLDYDVLTSLVDDIKLGMIKDGTAIGLGIANAVNRLRESDAKSKVIILITDGENNSGNIDPITAAELAQGFGIKIYTIGIGKGGLVPFPIDDPLFGRRYVQAKVDIDEKVLKRIADITNGIFFRARDTQGLQDAYKKIDKLEKSEIKVKEYSNYNELFHYALWPALLILLLEIILGSTVLIKLP